MRPSWPPPNTPIVEPGRIGDMADGRWRPSTLLRASRASVEGRTADSELLLTDLGRDCLAVLLQFRTQLAARRAEDGNGEQSGIRGASCVRNCRSTARQS